MSESATMTTPLMFLLKLAWDCRYRLPLLITVGFMVLDVRMQLDINVQMHEIHRQEAPPIIPADVMVDNLSDSSWTTFEEQEIDLQDE
ncbi:unnamed protein product [Ceutorhynchus assimilis]|uniref:Uncharacterized protein n=1 Tax=Ceutorhynchus assimilis TaxID=467358 RepID=A0A9P0DUW7_9CUCU|nr:unnamed protein product [Ceutorhynchus assimilis]